jgi:hypothetical protein
MGQQIDYPVLCYQTRDGWLAFTPALPAAHGGGRTAGYAVQDLEGAVTAVLDQMSSQELADHLADLADCGPIFTTTSTVLSVPVPASPSRTN